MRLPSVATFLLTGLVLVRAPVLAASSTPLTDTHPDFVSPYQPYELKLKSFCPARNRPAGVLLHVRINGGRPLRLVLDSGAESIVIDARTAHSLGLSGASEIDLVGLRTKSAKTGMVQSVDIGPLSFRNCRVDLVDGEVVEGADGVVPLALFSDFLMRLDLPGRTLGLFPYPDEQGPTGSTRRAATNVDLLLVKTQFNRKRAGYVVLDTGAFCSAISREVAGTLDSSQFLPDLPIATGTGAAAGRLVFGAVHFEIAGRDLAPDRVVALDLLNLSRHYGVEVIGVLGFPALSSYVLTIDYRNRSVKIGPKPRGSLGERHHSYPENSPTSLALH
ncbi:MAG: retropepsin-like aspartic protease [Terriglobia bacterium]